jgi:hypothetical protein
MPAARSREHWTWLVCACAVPVLLFGLALALEPDPRGHGTHEQLGFQPCYPMAHWNVPCPGCGVTTSLALLVRGRGLEALRTQPLGPGLALVLASSLVWVLVLHVRERDAALEVRRRNWKGLARVLIALSVLAWLYKTAAVRGWIG